MIQMLSIASRNGITVTNSCGNTKYENLDLSLIVFLHPLLASSISIQQFKYMNGIGSSQVNFNRWWDLYCSNWEVFILWTDCS